MQKWTYIVARFVYICGRLYVGGGVSGTMLSIKVSVDSYKDHSYCKLVSI